jgi:hypothetical protein
VLFEVEVGGEAGEAGADDDNLHNGLLGVVWRDR